MPDNDQKVQELLIEREILDAYKSFCSSYHNKSDMETLKQFFFDDITHIGSRKGEFCIDSKQVEDFFQKDLFHCSPPLERYQKYVKITVYTDELALLVSEFDLQTEAEQTPLQLKGYRNSIIWMKSDGRWLIKHIHLSMSEPELQEGELAMEENNRLMERSLHLKTRKLCELEIELSRTKKDMVDLQQGFDSIFEEVADGVIVIDWGKKKFHKINRGFCDITGYDELELKQMWLNDLIPNDKLSESVEKIHRQSLKEISLAEDIPIFCKNRKIKYFNVKSLSFRKEKQKLTLIFFHEVTYRKQAEYFQQEAESARIANENKNLFLANMSHEIRTPVTGIIGMTNILSRTHLTAEQAGNLKIVNSSSKALLGLIDDLMDISKIEAGQIRIKNESFNLPELLHNIQTISNPIAISKNNQLKITQADDIPSVIKADKYRLEQILMNLVNNAMKFTSNGQIHINVCHQTSPHNSPIKISVADTGIGIDPANQKMLFQQFQQFDNPTKAENNGTGLGLYICKKLVSLMGGEIGVDSVPGQGSTFWFTFQPQKVKLPSYSAGFHIEEDDDSWDVDLGLHILLVEDKPVNVKVISLMLQTANCKVDTATNGQEALDKFNPGNHQVILMDIMMPIMDGITAMKEIRKKFTNDIPIIAITANAMRGDEEKYLALGFDAYIAKPVSMHKLTSNLKKLGILNTNN